MIDSGYACTDVACFMLEEPKDLSVVCSEHQRKNNIDGRVYKREHICHYVSLWPCSGAKMNTLYIASCDKDTYQRKASPCEQQVYH